MNDRAKVGLIFGAVALAAGGGLFYFLKIHQPKQARAKAQAEVVAWEQRWSEARSCLLGASPASGKGAEALAVREMMPDPWNRGTCTKLIARLSRGVTEDTGLMPVEHAWMTVDRAASKVANAFATHVDPFGEAVESRGKPSPLPEALEGLDAAHAQLRLAAGMPPPPAAAQPSLPAAEVIAIKLGDADVTGLQMLSMPSAGGSLAFGEVKGVGEVQVVLAPGVAPRLTRVASGVLRALGDPSWGAAGLMHDLVIGAVDDAGALSATATFKLPAYGKVFAAAGKLDDGLVAYGVDAKLGFARATAGAAFAATEPPFPIAAVTSAVDLSGRALVAWATTDGAISAMITSDGSPPNIVALGSGYPTASCLTATHGWIAAAEQFVRFDGSGGTPHVLATHELVGCSETTALIRHRREPGEFAACGETCRVVKLAGAGTSRTATLVGDKVVSIRSRDRVLGVWREAGAPRFFALPDKFTPRVADSDGKVVDVIGSLGDQTVIVRVPVR